MSYTYDELIKLGAKPVEPKSYTYQDLIKLGAKPIETQPQEQPDQNNILQSAFTSLIGRPTIRAGQAVVGAGVEAFGNEQQKQNYYNAINQPVKLPMGLGTVEPQKSFGQGGGKQIIGNTAETGSYLLPYGKITGAVTKGFAPVAKAGIPIVSKYFPKLAGEAVAGATGGYGFDIKSNAEQDKPLFTPGINTLLGAGIGVVAPPIIGAVANKIKSKLGILPEKQIELAVLKRYEKGVKPLINAKMTPNRLEAYRGDVIDAVKTIKENKPNLRFNDVDGIEVVGETPKSLQQLADSIEQTKKSVFTKYDTLAKQAGKAGIGVDTKPIAQELDVVINNKALVLTNPNAVKYAQATQARYASAGKLDATTAQDVIQNYNKSLEAFYRNPSYDNASQAAIDAMVANNMRKALDEGITGLTGTEYSALKRQYGSLKAIEKDVIKASLRDARKNTKGLIDFTDVFSGGQVINGILSLNPAQIASGLTQKGIASFYKYLNNPNRAIEKMFFEVEKLPQSLIPSKNFQTTNAIIPKQKPNNANIPPTLPQTKSKVNLLPKERGELLTIKSSILPVEKTIQRKKIVENVYKEGSYTGKDTKGNDVFGGKVKQEKRLDIVMGLPGSGKSTVVVNPLSKEFGSIVVDSDRVKTRLASPADAMKVHDLSSDITESDLFLKALRNGDNIVLPKVGGKLVSLQQMADLAKSKGYEVHLHHVAVSPETSLARTQQRAIDTGRVISPDTVKSYGNRPAENFNILKESPTYKSYTNYNNEVPLGEKPKLTDASIKSPVVQATIKRATELTKKNSGVTISLNGDIPTSGFSVADSKLTEKVLNKPIITDADVENYVGQNIKSMLASNRHLGIWIEDGKIYFDVPLVLKDKLQAINVAKKADQLGIFDLSNFETIKTK